VKFERDLLLEMLPDADNVPVRVIGRIGELTWFSAATTMCLHRPGLHLPAGDTFSAGTRLLLSWSAPAGTTPDHYDLWFTADGENWEKVLAGLTTTTTGWIVPNHVSANARLELFAFDRHTAMGSDRSAPFRITPPTTDALAATGRPGLFNLRSIGPNPTTGDAKLELAVPGPGAVTVTVFDVSGARVRKLVAREFEPGWHTVTWDGTGEDGRLLGAGVYFVRAEHGDRKVNLRVARVR
jgi:hypothetical protein